MRKQIMEGPAMSILPSYAIQKRGKKIWYRPAPEGLIGIWAISKFPIFVWNTEEEAVTAAESISEVRWIKMAYLKVVSIYDYLDAMEKGE